MSAQARWFFILIATFLVPNSQAVISHYLTHDMDSVGYHCTMPGKSTSITVDYSHTKSGLPCSVNYRPNSYSAQELLTSTRNVETCEIKARRMSERLLDRGWRCQASG